MATKRYKNPERRVKCKICGLEPRWWKFLMHVRSKHRTEFNRWYFRHSTRMPFGMERDEIGTGKVNYE